MRWVFVLTLCTTCALQLIRSGDTYLSVTNFHDLLSLMCPDFQLRVVKSAFKAAWVVLKGMGFAGSCCDMYGGTCRRCCNIPCSIVHSSCRAAVACVAGLHLATY